MIDFKLGIDAVQSYQRLSYKHWYALAEFIDNSTQSYLNNKHLLDEVYAEEGSPLTVEITYKNGQNGFIKIEDNSLGMDEDDLKAAFNVGLRPKNNKGRSKYGLGMKTASFWFGDKWEIKTKKLDADYEYTVEITLAELIAASTSQEKAKTKTSGNQNGKADKVSTKHLTSKKRKVERHEHYTHITITQLNRHFSPSTVKRTKDHLRSMYRHDFQKGELVLIFQHTPLEWNHQEFIDRMIKDEDETPYYREFSINVGGRKVEGWAGVLETGSRKDAGFSIVQAGRMIKGWPDAYRPETIFGEQEAGTNNLVNQRLAGEICLDDFDVSHTKDDILFRGSEEDELEDALYEELKDFKKLAAEYRKPRKDENGEEDIDVTSIVNDVFKAMQAPKFISTVKRTSSLPPDILEKAMKTYLHNLEETDNKDTYQANIAGVEVRIIINRDASPFDPYLLIRPRAVKNKVTIIINKNHHHWATLTTSDLMIYFIKHCVFDGLAEWKVWKDGDPIEPDTIKMLKDAYLRQDIDLN